MNTQKLSYTSSSLYQAALLAIILFGPSFASAQATKSTKAAPAKAAAPAKPAAPAAAHPGAATAAHGPTTAGASHGPTTSNPSGHGVTTANTGHGVTTSTAGHGPTTGGGVHPATTPAGGRPGMGAGVHPGGAAAHPAMVGGHPVAAGNHVMHTPGGADVRMRANGRPGDIHMANRGMDIHHGLNGNRRVEVMRADHSRIVAERGGHGFVERPYHYGGRDYAHRTYYYHGRPYDRYYGHYYYHGGYVDYYTPAYYYRPAFYGWAYNPWVAPVPYAWGWGGNPWYGYYGYYFTPYPAYPSASAWLTDYMISTGLAAAYEAQAQAPAAANSAPPPDAAALTPQTKDLIAQEVQRQIALENQEAQGAQTAATDPASSSVQRMLTDNVQHVFVAGSDLDLVDASGAECAVSAGDALQLAGPPPADATAATLVMLSSKGGTECRKGITVTVNITDLQEMQNHMRETIDQGMADMQSKQAKGGLPAIPASATGAPVKAAFAADAPGPDPDAAKEISQEAQQADQAEKETLAQVSQPSGPNDQSAANAAPAPGPAPAPATLSLGQSIDEVTAIEGTPKSVANIGTKKIYVFNDGIKVTFKDGKATDVQ